MGGSPHVVLSSAIVATPIVIKGALHTRVSSPLHKLTKIIINEPRTKKSKLPAGSVYRLQASLVVCEGDDVPAGAPGPVGPHVDVVAVPVGGREVVGVEHGVGGHLVGNGVVAADLEMQSFYQQSFFIDCS